MDLLFTCANGRLSPAEDAASDYMRKHNGETQMWRRVRSRSAPQIRLYYAVLKFVCEHGRGVKPGEDKKLHVSLKVALHQYELVELFQNKATLVIDSLGFDGMTHDEATDYIRRAYDLLCERFFPNLTPEQLVAKTQEEIGLRPVDSPTLRQQGEAA